MEISLNAEIINQEIPLFLEDARPLNLENYLNYNFRSQEIFANQLIEKLSQRGFFYLERPHKFLNQYGLDECFDNYYDIYQKALRERPYLLEFLKAKSVFETGYHLTYYPESTMVNQEIEAFMIKPTCWKTFYKHEIPKAVHRLLETTKKVHMACYLVAFVLLNALELAYNLKQNRLSNFFVWDRGGSVRFVKYHDPFIQLSQKIITTHVSEPHIDKSFFTINLGESHSGLVWIKNGNYQLLPNYQGYWLITSGLYAQGLTRHTECPITPFDHTVINRKERIVVLGFVSPKETTIGGKLYKRPLEKWPILY